MLSILIVIAFLDKRLLLEESVPTVKEDDCRKFKGCCDAAVLLLRSFVWDKLAFSFEDCLCFYNKQKMK